MKRIELLIALILCINISACKIHNKMEEKFEWDATECAPEMYPMNIARGYLVFSDGNSTLIPSADMITNGWGKDGSTWAIGDELKPVPISLEITWLSFTENKFYGGRFTLPKDNITRLFEEGFIIPWNNKHETYNTIMVGMAPGGIVVIWLLGSSGHQVEVGRYQAKEINLAMKDYIDLKGYGHSPENDNQNTYVKRSLEDDTVVLENLRNKGLQLGLWDKYRERFNVRPIIVYDDSDVKKTDELYTSYFNGEQSVLFTEQLNKDDYVQKARPRTMGISWVSHWTNKETRYWAEIYFKEDEIFKAYQEVYGDDKTQPVELIVHVNMNNDSLRIYLKSKTKQVELLQSRDEIYLDPENKHNYPTVRYDQVTNDQ
ncbi:MAG TPA: DUF2931 family protein [Ferruginibacter sp.]|jgi:hypothetical protein|nr:DUF2931 family protein [Ferruginibacter sp.]